MNTAFFRNLMSHVDLKVDTQLVGALLQVIAAMILGIIVYRQTTRDRKQALAINMDQEWNASPMIKSRRAIARLLSEDKAPPKIVDADFDDYWVIRMYFQRLAAMKQSGNLDDGLYRALQGRDAVLFAREIHRVWGDDGVDSRDMRILEAPR